MEKCQFNNLIQHSLLCHSQTGYISKLSCCVLDLSHIFYAFTFCTIIYIFVHKIWLLALDNLSLDLRELYKRSLPSA